MSLRILVTGGTFDKEYDEINGKLDFEETHVPEMLKLGRSTLTIEVHTIMMIDSLDMTNEHRTTIVDSIKNVPETQIVITHGTDTMAETAAFIAKEHIDKTIVITGAMIPYKFGSSDGFFNLGSSIAFAQMLPHGVYVVMNGRYYHWDNVKKNKQTGLFQELN
jgi:L-asparaginase